MNIIDVENYIFKIKEAVEKHDDEVAHRLEKELYTKVLEETAKGKNCELLAKYALITQNIQFHRWFA